MIDFRYHLVSLVSVFMALAIGVVLGAGPLKEAIGDQLSNQVEGLLQDKTALQQAVANRDQRISERDAFVEAVTPGLVREQLGGQSVVLVTLPGGEAQDPEQLTGVLESAGARVTGRVDLLDRWFDPDQREFRRTLAGSQVHHLDPPPAATAGAEAELAAVLARAVLTKDLALAGQDDPLSHTLLGALTGGDLAAVSGTPTQRATTVVVLSPAPVTDGEDEQDGDVAGSVLTLLRALDAAGNGTLLAGPLTAATGDGLIAALRSSDLDAVSSVDGADTPMGRIAVVNALREQLAGGSGDYGSGDGARSPLPEQVTTPPPPTTDDPTIPDPAGE